MVATKKKPAPPKFHVTNSEDITKLPKPLQEMWELMTKMDPEGVLFVNDVAIVLVDGEGPKERTPKALGFTADQTELVKTYGVLDADEADDQASARGVIFTAYQLAQACFEAGCRYEQSQMTSAITTAASDDDEDEDFDDDEDEIEDTDDEVEDDDDDELPDEDEDADVDDDE